MTTSADPFPDRFLRGWPLAFALAGVSILLYARVLDAFFVADDFAFLELVAGASSPLVIFAPLAERYVRPMVVLIYYVNYQLAGLSPLLYHLTVLGVHLVSTWLVFRVGCLVAPDRGTFLPALAALLFAVFGGHAEAVSWLGGMADPLVTMFVLLAVLLFARSQVAVRPAWPMIGSWIAFLGALLSKESAVAYPALAAAVALLGPFGPLDRRRIRRAIVALGVPALMLAGYFAARRAVLGFALVDLQGIGAAANPLASVRAFVLRSFFPHSDLLVLIWESRLDAIVLLPLAALLLWLARREWRTIGLLTLCLAISLAPVLPLTIAIGRTDSERFIYLPSAFACLLLVRVLCGALRRRWAVAAIVLVCAAGHAVALDRSNRMWGEAAAITRGITSTFAELLRQHGVPGGVVYVLNVPDNVHGAFVYRRGFLESLRLTAPDQIAKLTRVGILSVHSVYNASAPVRVTRSDPLRFDVEFGTAGGLIGMPAESHVFTFERWDASGFTARLTPSFDRGLVVYTSPSRVRLAATLDGPQVPFGVIDSPADPAVCAGRTLQLGGWTLDVTGISRVFVETIPADAASPLPLGPARRFARPDVHKFYPNYPDGGEAGWLFDLPCDRVARAPGGSLRIRVIAENRKGQTASIGTRTVQTRR